MKEVSMDENVRPWGHYEILSDAADHKVKTIFVDPASRLSYQRHKRRAEHWFIVSGIAKVTHNGVEKILEAGATIDIAIGDLHRIENIGAAQLVFIEVQTGTYFGEDDIERIEDDYSR